MCLETKRFFSKKTARKNIVVYKHLKMRNLVLITPYQRTPVEVPGVVNSSLYKYREYYHKFNRASVNIGIHSFKNIDDCKEDARQEYSSHIVECVIPKGASYYAGKFNDMPSFASNSIEYVKVINVFEDRIGG